MQQLHAAANDDKKAKQRWRFGVRWQFAAVAVIVLICGWYGRHLPRYRTENKALTEIAVALGSKVEYTRGGGLAPPGMEYVNVVYLPACSISDYQVKALIAHLRQLPKLISVDIHDTTLAPESLQRLKAALPQATFGSVASNTRRRAIAQPDSWRQPIQDSGIPGKEKEALLIPGRKIGVRLAFYTFGNSSTVSSLVNGVPGAGV